MKASKSHFEMTAEVLRVHRKRALADGRRSSEREALLGQIRNIAEEFAAEFARINPAFNHTRFMKACGLPAIPGSIRAQVIEVIEPAADYEAPLYSFARHRWITKRKKAERRRQNNRACR